MFFWRRFHQSFEAQHCQIARAFSRALVHGLGIGSTPLTVRTDVGRPLPVPGNFQVFTSAIGVSATWDKGTLILGCVRASIDSVQCLVPTHTTLSIESMGVRRSISPPVMFCRTDGTPAGRWTGGRMSFAFVAVQETRERERGRHGEVQQLGRRLHHHRRMLSFVPLRTDWVRFALALDTLWEAMLIIFFYTDVSWTPPTGPFTDTLEGYRVYWYDLETPCVFLLGAAFRGNSASITGMTVGNRHLIAIEPWNAAGAGFPIVTRSIRPGRGTPAVSLRLVHFEAPRGLFRSN